MGAWAIALVVFLARMLQNTVGTVRDIMVIRGERGKAAALSFSETMIWLIVFCVVLQDFLTKPVGWVTVMNFLAFAGGFALGSYVGILVEEKMALGYVAIEVIPARRDEEVGRELKRAGFPLTIFPCKGERGPHRMYLSVVPRRQMSSFLKHIHNVAPSAFVTVTDARVVRSWVFRRQRA
jgi:uncharacterized protein YebE (UPF0316 family)